MIDHIVYHLYDLTYDEVLIVDPKTTISREEEEYESLNLYMLMDNRDYMKAFGEWLCSIAPNSFVKSLTHNSVRDLYERDYVIVTNLCNGFGKIPAISIKTIDGATERYKEFNKAVLEISPLSEEEKKEVSAQIDLNAEEQKRNWVSILQAKGIIITEY